VTNGGIAYVTSGGIDEFSVVNKGGLEFISSAGTISGGTVITGGTITVSSGGVVSGGLTISGGTAVISAAVAGGQTVTFAGKGGDLTLGDPADFAAKIAGFGKGDTIDVGGFAYPGTTVAYSSGTLTVSGGGSQVQFTLTGGSYHTSNFTPSNDGSGGTLITYHT
jgi:autotransporter passenger strand-loop-strand repeat protein